MDSLPKGKVQTVCGPVDPQALGFTLPHEHLYHKATAAMFHPREPDPRYSYLSQSPFDPENLWWINFHPYSHADNLRFTDIVTQEAVLEELKFYKSNGGETIAEVTTFGRDLKVLQSNSKQTGVNIVAGAGFYVASGQTPDTLNMTVEQISASIVKELTVGDNGIKCGLIGEIGTSYPVDPFEKRVLQASAGLQEQYGVPVILHPGRDSRAPFEVMRIYLEAGGRVDKTVMSHLDRSLLRDSELLEFAKMGTFCEFDLFGIETSYYELSDTLDMPSDAQRVDRLKTLIGEGFQDKVLVSMDIHTKQRLMKFAGHGFSHILLNTVPKMRLRGYTESQINSITVENPRKWLTL
jgi:phosphotriesterase-related protein